MDRAFIFRNINQKSVRPDRDDFVTIHFDKIEAGFEGNFAMVSESSWVDQNIGYDIASVMQYSGYGFSIDGTPTITYNVNGVD
jgi:hypothetical protein